MTQASMRALEGIRDLATMQWYAIPLLAIIFYIYVVEVGRARRSGDWRAVIAGAALFGADWFNENWNGWILALGGHSALWTTPGPTALRLTVGWNLEIVFMFSILGVIYWRSLSGKKGSRILGIREKWFFAIGYSLICVIVECFLNLGGLLVWEYPFWNLSPWGIIPIYFLGYFWFFAWTILVMSRKGRRAKILFAAIPYAAGALLAIVAAIAGLRY